MLVPPGASSVTPVMYRFCDDQAELSTRRFPDPVASTASGETAPVRGAWSICTEETDGDTVKLKLSATVACAVIAG